MTESIPHHLKSVLSEKLAESLQGDIVKHTLRTISGVPSLPGKATVIVGMRRVGKTTYLQQLRQQRFNEGTSRNRLPLINFEDERLSGLVASHLGFLVDELERSLANTPSTGRVLWCLDEIQVVPGWEKFVRRLLDLGTVDIAVTGSSAALLSKEISTSLRGRAWTIFLAPFSFYEYLQHHSLPVPDHSKATTSTQRAKVEKAFTEWLITGGFPEVQGLDLATRNQLLIDYVDVAILRDVVERHSISNVLGLRYMVRSLLGNAGAFFSIEKLHASLKSQGHNISRDTMHQMLSYLEDCFLVRLVAMESSSLRQRMVNPRKAYPADTGLIPLFDQSGKSNHGHALETAVLVELERRRCSVSYVKTLSGYEVDFLAKYPDGHSELIQVCADASDAETAERELRALREAKVLAKGGRKILLVMNHNGYPDKIPDGIEVMSAWVWMTSVAR